MPTCYLTHERPRELHGVSQRHDMQSEARLVWGQVVLRRWCVESRKVHLTDTRFLMLQFVSWICYRWIERLALRESLQMID